MTAPPLTEQTVLEGDVLTRLRALPADSVQCAVTSPPYYGLRDYGLPPTTWGDGWTGCLGLEPTIALFLTHLLEVFGEVRRVLRPDGVLFVNIGDSYAGSGKGPTGHNGLQDAETRQGFTGVGTKHQDGRAAGVIPTQTARRVGRGIRGGRGYELHDPIAVAGCKAKDLMLMPERVAIAMQDASWWVRSRIAWTKPAPMPESVRDRPTSAWEHIWLFTKSARYFWDAEAVRQPQTPGSHLRWGHGERRAMNTPRQTVAGSKNANNDSYRQATPYGAAQDGSANLRNVWRLGSEPSRYEYCSLCDSFYLGAERRQIRRVRAEDGSTQSMCPSCLRSDGWVAHYAAFPTALARLCILAGTSRDQASETSTVLDPFLGSGTTLVASRHLGRRGTGIELSATYAGLARQRIERDVPKWARPVSVKRRNSRPPTPAQPSLLEVS